jgi:hypothetical protein
MTLISGDIYSIFGMTFAVPHGVTEESFFQKDRNRQ